MRINPLLTQNRDTRTNPGRNERSRNIQLRIKRQHRLHARIGGICQTGIFGIGTGWIVTHACHLPTGFTPDLVQICTTLFENFLGIAGNHNMIRCRRFSDNVTARPQIDTAQDIHDHGFLCGPYLDNSTQFLIKQCAQGLFVTSFCYLCRPVFGFPAISTMALIHRQDVHIDIQTEMTGKRHFTQGCHQTTVRAIMVSQNLLVTV